MNFFSSRRINGTLSIDRVTFLVFSPKLSLWSEEEAERRANMHHIQQFSNLIEMRLFSQLDSDFCQGQSTLLYKKHYRTTSGIDLQFGPVFPVRKKKKNDEQDDIDKYIYQPSFYCFRIEYNPNKTSLMDIKPLFLGFKNFTLDRTVMISRLDIAIDYIASISPELILCRGIKKNCIFGGKKGIETVYFGRRTSKNFFRIYNKRQEIIDSGLPDPLHDIWRFELEYSDSFPLSFTPDLGPQFDKLTILPGTVIDDCSDDWILQMLLENSLYSGSLENTLNKLPLSTRKRYIEKLKLYFEKISTLEDPAYVYRKNFSDSFCRVRSDIIQLFSNSGVI